MDSIERVDEMVRKNIAKYTQQKQQKLYQKQIQEYEKQRKKDALRSYAEIIKQGNKRAIEKMKQAKLAKEKSKRTKKNKTKPVVVEQVIENVQDNGQNKKNKLNQNEIKKIQAAIQSRAERILQQKQLDKLDKCLAEERKKTKLYELNERCRKIAKSSVKMSAMNSVVPEDRRKILEQFERKAIQEIQELDNIIGNIISDKNGTMKEPNLQQFKKTKSVPKIKSNIKVYEHFEQPEYEQKQYEIESTQTINLHPFDSPIFTKSTEELLSLNYIPL